MWIKNILSGVLHIFVKSKLPNYSILKVNLVSEMFLLKLQSTKEIEILKNVNYLSEETLIKSISIHLRTKYVIK